MATNEQTLDDLLNSVIQGEACVLSKAWCLHLALKEDNINLTTIQTLLDHGADPYFMMCNLRPVISPAVCNRSDNVECLKLLLEHKMPALAANKTCLGISLTTVKKYRKRKAEKKNVLNKLLGDASGCSNSKCVTYLLEKGACVNYPDYAGVTPLVAACTSESDETSCLETVNILLNHGANTMATNAYSPTAIHSAKSRISVINRLLAAGCDVNMQNGDHCTPLIDLVRNSRRHSNIEAIKNLLKFGAKMEYVSDEYNSRSALFWAVLHEVEVVELFLQEGADPDFIETSVIYFYDVRHVIYAHTCSLTNAIAEYNVTAVKLLIQYNCDVDSNMRDVGRIGKTISAFRLASCLKSSVVMCKMLALAGCDRLEMNNCITEWDSERLQSANAHLWEEVKAMASSPFMLKQLSRLSIRHNLRQLGRRIMVVSQLPLPKYLQEYMMFKELDNYIDA